ncbi:hypothetical protein DL93DRAFT_2078670 [Clavulina sp. PMI_390]|nr:hypothetical protein DL93DRAFT_2078670 [Clavulina sp. PMI_390]
MRSTQAIPVDILFSIIDCLEEAKDRTTMKEVALVNRDALGYVNRYIWREFSITTYPAKPLLTPFILRERCAAIVRDKQRARCIRSLSMSFRYAFDTYMSIVTVGHAEAVPDNDGVFVPVSEETERGLEHLFDAVAAAIAACSEQLETLSIFGPWHLSDLGNALARLIERGPVDLTQPLSFAAPRATHSNAHHSPTISPPLVFPNLQTISSTLAASHGVMPFFINACPEVRTWKISGRGALLCMENITPELFPKLESFEGLSMHLQDVTTARKIREVSIINGLDTAAPSIMKEFYAGLAASAVPVLELSINVTIYREEDGRTNDRRVLRQIARAAPNLQYLEIFSHGEYARYDYEAIARDQYADSLVCFRDLREFHWWDKRGHHYGPKFPQACFERVASLQSVYVNKTQYDRPMQGVNDGAARLSSQVEELEIK